MEASLPPKPKYYNRIYVVELDRGRSHPEWYAFSTAVSDLNGKAPDYGGINKTVLIGTHHDLATLKMMVTTDMEDRSAVLIEEITTATLKANHRPYTSLVESYYLPYKNYRNIRL